MLFILIIPHKVPGVHRAAQNGPDAVVAPLVAVILLALKVALIAALTPLCGGVGGRAEDVTGVEVVADFGYPSPIQRHLKNQLHHRGRFFVNDKVVVVGGVFQIAVWGRGGHIQAAVEPGPERRFDLHGHVGGVHLVRKRRIK